MLSIAKFLVFVSQEILPRMTIPWSVNGADIGRLEALMFPWELASCETAISSFYDVSTAVWFACTTVYCRFYDTAELRYIQYYNNWRLRPTDLLFSSFHLVRGQYHTVQYL